MPSATAPPLIAPGIVCPKCKGPMLDERASKRTDKSPDYTCANLTCVTPGKTGKSYRTAIWAEKSANGSAGGEMGKPTAGTSASAPSAEPVSAKLKLTDVYMKSSQFVIDKIVPLYVKADIGVSDEAVAAMVATLFIAATKER